MLLSVVGSRVKVAWYKGFYDECTKGNWGGIVRGFMIIFYSGWDLG